MPPHRSPADEPADAAGRSADSARPDARPPLAEALRAISWNEPKTAWRQLVGLFGLPKLIGAVVVVVLVVVAFVLPGGEGSDPFEGPGAALDLTLKLGAVLALLYVALAALKRYTGGTAKQRGTLLDVLDSKTLAPNRSVYVIRAGEKRLVLGVTQNQITTLAELDAEPSVRTGSQADFAAQLQQELRAHAPDAGSVE
jgi:flagellar biosynthetic protein FliO